MKLSFDFSNGTPPVKFEADTVQATPIELLVSATGDENSRKESLMSYIMTLDYMFKGVANLVSTKIMGVSVEKSWFGKIEKQAHHVKWNAVSDKSLVVVYDIAIDAISESMYVADAVNSGKDIKSLQAVWSKQLFDRSPRTARDNIITAISIATETLTDYKMAWGYGGNNYPVVFDSDGDSIAPEDVEDDESFILIKLLLLLATKSTHMGVYIVNCEGFSDRVLRAFSSAVREYHGDAFIFFYNVPADCQVERVQVELPDVYKKAI